LNIQANDIILISVNNGNNGSVQTYPSGFGAITGLSTQAISGSGNLSIQYKVATGSEPASYTVSSTATGFMTADLRVYSGRNASSPFTATAATASTTSSGATVTLALTGVTAAVADDVVLFAGFGNGSVNSGSTFHLSLPTGFANREDPIPYANISFGTVMGSSDYANNPGGATGTLAPVATSDTSSFANYVGFVLSMAVQPSGGGGQKRRRQFSGMHP
jgi:hypothetical protein